MHVSNHKNLESRYPRTHKTLIVIIVYRDVYGINSFIFKFILKGTQKMQSLIIKKPFVCREIEQKMKKKSKINNKI